jgi:Fe-S-cluster-containing hydrogenase component 2
MYVCALAHEGVADLRFSRIQIIIDVQNGYLCDINTCSQCSVAECMLACHKKAIGVDENTGAKVVDSEVCIGCGLCSKSCPATTARVTLVKSVKKAVKCDLCGGDPQCVSLCPMGALKYKEVKNVR